MKAETLQRFIDAQNNLVVQHSDFSLRALFDMARSQAIDLAPHYQRRDRWKPDKQSALIESFLLNVPVPPVYLSEDEFGKYSVIDGKQRLTAIRDFLGGDLKLTKLTKFSDLEGASFTDLPQPIQNALAVRPYIRVITLLKQTDPQLKYEVFLRLNTGGEKLLAQEIRNVAFSGPLNDLLFELSEATFLRRQMKIKGESSPPYRRMEDVEHVLRFLTMAERWRVIGPQLSLEMDDYMQQYRAISPSRSAQLRQLFQRSLDACEGIWGDKAFYKPQGNGWRGQFISPLFDAEMVAVSALSASELAKAVKHRELVLKRFVTTFKGDPFFAKSVTQSTNNPSSVTKRISTVASVLRNWA